jgi:hypothetical protein
MLRRFKIGEMTICRRPPRPMGPTRDASVGVAICLHSLSPHFRIWTCLLTHGLGHLTGGKRLALGDSQPPKIVSGAGDGARTRDPLLGSQLALWSSPPPHKSKIIPVGCTSRPRPDQTPKNGGHFVAMFRGKRCDETGTSVPGDRHYRYESAHNGLSQNRLGRLHWNSQGGDRGFESRMRHHFYI